MNADSEQTQFGPPHPSSSRPKSLTKRILISLLFLGLPLVHSPAYCQDDGQLRFLPGASIPVGVGTLLSGEQAPVGREILEGATAFLKGDVSVLGHPLELQPMDDRCDKETTTQLAKKFCSMVPRPVAVLGYLCSPGTLAALEIHRDCRLPLLNVSSADPQLTAADGQWVIRLCASHAHQGSFVCRWIQRRRFRRVLLIHEDDPISQAIVERTRETLPKLSRRTELTVAPMDDMSTSYEEAFSGKTPPQLVVYVGEGLPVSSLWNEFPPKGLKVPWILDQRAVGYVSVADDEPRPQDLYSLQLLPLTGDPQSPALQFFRGRYGEPGFYTPIAYDAMAVLLDALRRCGRQGSDKTEWAKDDLLKALKETRIQGLTGPISFDGRGDRKGVTGRIRQWKDGEWKAHWTGAVP